MKKLAIFIGLFFGFVLVVSLVVALVSGGGGISHGDKVALVRLEGPIFGSDSAVEEIKGHRKDDSIKAIVLRVNSPGGAVAPSQEIYQEVKRAAAQKPLVVSMGTVAASGGYYVSAPATRIFANPGTLTGSIGVIMEIPNFQGLMEKVGVSTQVVKSGALKDLASTSRKMTDEERRVLQGAIDDVYGQFVADVAASRKMDIDKLRELADGRVYTGAQALKIGLVDEMGGLEEAVAEAAKLAGIEGEPDLVEKEEDFSIKRFIEGAVKTTMPDVSPGVRLKYIIYP